MVCLLGISRYSPPTEVKAPAIAREGKRLLRDLEQSVHELNLVKQGKLAAISCEELLSAL